MANLSNSVLIAATEASHACDLSRSVEENARACFLAVRDHWLITSYKERVQAGLAGLVMAYQGHPEQERILTEINALSEVAAALDRGDGGAVMAVMARMPEDFPYIKLREIGLSVMGPPTPRR